MQTHIHWVGAVNRVDLAQGTMEKIGPVVDLVTGADGARANVAARAQEMLDLEVNDIFVVSDVIEHVDGACSKG